MITYETIIDGAVVAFEKREKGYTFKGDPLAANIRLLLSGKAIRELKEDSKEDSKEVTKKPAK